ncbi:hypothetical protein DAPK24_034530 [Pichia kluyveri]|uniref:Endoplasmic reticulum transmembrane protein n=1 Tax=Pichia kluyveri TaxID=36015 RepID=A0AAV5R639_PICKL|nr:hypothetical protein DAPK24_034530 [Pichia kluyveri]
MSIQMNLVFTLLIIETIIISILLLPLPPKIQKKLINYYDLSIKNTNFSIILIFIDSLVSIMFVDSIKNGFKFNSSDEIIEFNKNIWDNRSKKFYSQRNMYILGAILSIQMLIWFLIIMIKSIVKNKNILLQLSKEEEKSVDNELTTEYEKLKIDVDTLNKQYDSLWKAYSEKNKNETTEEDNKKDN